MMKKKNDPDWTSRSFTKPICKLYEDEFFIAFDKPAGLLVVPTNRAEENTLTNIVNFQFREGDQGCKLHPCHRLDRETSGAILYAKGKKSQQIMMSLFQEKKIEKKYVAFVWGRLSRKSGVIDRTVMHREKRNLHPGAKPLKAQTEYKVVDEKKYFSVVEVKPLTGRTNQIRIHFKDIGYPLVGERKYVIAKDYPLRFKRVALHSLELSFQHPETGIEVSIKSDFPEDMKKFLNKKKGNI